MSTIRLFPTIIKPTLSTFLSLLILSAASSAFGLDVSKAYYFNVIGGQLNMTQRTTEHPSLYIIDGHVLDTAFATSSTSAAMDVGLEGGVILKTNPRLDILLGAGLYRSADAKVSGNYYFNGSTAADATYQYNLSTMRLMFTGTGRYTLFTAVPALSVLGEVGLGYGQLTANAYSANQVDSLLPPSFGSESKNQLMYQYGLGAEYRLPHRWSVGLHYDWLVLGSAQLPSNNAEQTGGGSLSTGTVNSNRISLQVRYQFKTI